MPPQTTTVDSPQLTINGAPVPRSDSDALRDFNLSLTMGAPAELTFRLADPGFELVDGTRYVVGNEIGVSLPDATGTLMSVFLGEIVGVAVEQDAGLTDGCHLSITAFDLGHRLGRKTQVRTFQNMKYSDIVSQIAREHGLRAEVTDTRVKHQYLIQTTTNYAFLQEIAFRTGFEWRIVDKKLIFAPRASSAPIAVKYGEHVRRIRARYSSGSDAKQVQVRSWDPLTKKAVVGQDTIANRRSSGATGANSDLVSSGRTKANVFTDEMLTASFVATSSDEATQLARSLSSKIATADLSLRCECLGNPHIAPGKVVQVEDAGTKLSGNYYVTSVEHRFGIGGDLTTVFSTAPDESSIVELLGSGERNNPFGQLGLTIGIVTNNKDPDGFGRVRVKFPALSDNEESWWARVVTPGGGNQAGLMFMPQIDDEVLVGFEHGDLRRPFVIGGVWGAKAKPPTAAETFLAQNKVVQWGVRTMNGTTLALRSGEAPADKHYKLTLPDGTTHYMGSDKTEIIAMNKSIELKSGQGSITITDKGDIVIKGMNIKLEATQGVTVDGLTIAAKAKTSLKAEGTASLELKGGASANLEASGVTQVKGSLVKIQ